MIRVSPKDRAHSPDRAWMRRTDIPLAMILGWVAALIITTEGLMTFQNLYG